MASGFRVDCRIDCWLIIKYVVLVFSHWKWWPRIEIDRIITILGIEDEQNAGSGNNFPFSTICKPDAKLKLSVCLFWTYPAPSCLCAHGAEWACLACGGMHILIVSRNDLLHVMEIGIGIGRGTLLWLLHWVYGRQKVSSNRARCSGDLHRDCEFFIYVHLGGTLFILVRLVRSPLTPRSPESSWTPWTPCSSWKYLAFNWMFNRRDLMSCLQAGTYG